MLPSPAPKLSRPTPIGDLGMVNQRMQAPDLGYDGGGINPGGGPVNPNSPYPTPTAPAPITPPAGPMPTVPPGGVPSTPVQAPPQDFSPTAQNPLAPLNNYQAQQATGSYQAPVFQGGSSYQAGSYQAP